MGIITQMCIAMGLFLVASAPASANIAETFAEAKELAARDKKPVLIEFYRDD